MKESGINYFGHNLGLIDQEVLNVFYTFEDGTGTNVSSISGGQSLYSGVLNSTASFWDKQGSGFFSGTTLSVENASGNDSSSWTKIFVYEQTQTGQLVLFNSLTGGSGHKIGINDANKLYFESFYQEPVTATSTTNLSSKNTVSVSYATNYVSLGYFNFNSQQVEFQEYNYPFQVTRSDAQVLGGGAPYYADYYLHLNSIQSPSVIGQLLSGLYKIPTGNGYEITTNCTTGITGYQNVFVGQTGVTGYVTLAGGDEGRDYFTGAFPTFYTQSVLTGYLSSGLYASGLMGLVCSSVTGDYITLFETKTGYVSSFGMNKIQLFTPLIATDIVKTSYSYSLFNDIYNENTLPNYSGFFMASAYPSGLINIYYNGVAQAGSGWSLTGDYLFVSGAGASDAVWLDLKSGDKKSYPVANNQTGFVFQYSGQEIYLNGINLVSGYDFLVTGNVVNLTSRNTGINGDIFEIPIVLPSSTGLSTLILTSPYSRDTSNVYLNGVRQQENVLYVEGGKYDLLSGQFFNYTNVVNLYEDDDLYWEN